MRSWMQLALVVAVVFAGALLLGSAAAEACPAMERSAERAAASDSGSCLAWYQWAGAGAAAWLTLFGAAYAWGMRRR